MTDAQMVEAIRDLRPKMVGRAVNAGLQQADAEDLAERVIVKLWRSRRGIDHGHHWPYCWQAFSGMLSNWFRDRSKALEYEWPTDPFDDGELREFPDDEAHDPVIERESLRKLMRVLDPLDRRLLIDFYWRGYDGRELSERHGYRRSWAPRRMREAYEKMREVAA